MLIYPARMHTYAMIVYAWYIQNALSILGCTTSVNIPQTSSPLQNKLVDSMHGGREALQGRGCRIYQVLRFGTISGPENPSGKVEFSRRLKRVIKIDRGNFLQLLAPASRNPLVYGHEVFPFVCIPVITYVCSERY